MHGLISKITAVAGRRDALANILIDGTVRPIGGHGLKAATS